MQLRLLEALFSNRVIIRWNGLDQQIVGASGLNVFKNRLEMIRNTRMASSWTNLLSPRPPCVSFLLVRPHKVSYKVSNKLQSECTKLECELMPSMMAALRGAKVP